MNYIFIEYSIDCAHFLPHVTPGHKCGNMHGHRYDIRLEIAGEIGSESGWIVDYAEVRKKFDPIILALDHATLNKIQGLLNPTCENIVGYLLNSLPSDFAINCRLVAIEVRETDRAGAGWRYTY